MYMLGTTTWVNMACCVQQAKQSCSLFFLYVKAQNLSQILEFQRSHLWAFEEGNHSFWI